MSEVTTVLVKKKNNSSAIVIVSSFRDDTLPNTNLPESEIANTGFVLLVNSLSQENYLPKSLKEALQEKISANFLDLYFSKTTTDFFVKEAKISHLRSSFYFNISDLELNSSQISSLYSYMEFDPENGDYELNEDFFIDIFKNGDRGIQVEEILGTEKYRTIEPRIEFEIEFINPSHIEIQIDEVTTESSLDSHIFEWLKKE